ncbi:MAG: Smr/MutS family protein [Pseudomonadota bacterium]
MSDDAKDDADAFRAAVDGVRPLVHQRAEPRRPKAAPRARFREANEREALAESLTPTADSLERHGGEYLEFRRDHVTARTLRKLRRGVFRLDDELDLHGLTRADARLALGEFLDGAGTDGHRVVRIVHGKGRGSGPRGPVLKHAVAGWLARNDAVLAYVSARAVDGGTGALYVLLRRH